MRSATPALLSVVISGCWLEEVTGEPVPLEPAFYESVEASQGQPGIGGGSSVPFSSHEGQTVVVRGTIASELEDPIDIDVRTPDSTQEGGVKGHGKILLDAPGEFSLTVPRNLGALELRLLSRRELSLAPTLLERCFFSFQGSDSSLGFCNFLLCRFVFDDDDWRLC